MKQSYKNGRIHASRREALINSIPESSGHGKRKARFGLQPSWYVTPSGVLRIPKSLLAISLLSFKITRFMRLILAALPCAQGKSQ